jgi:hypothetical protein
MLFAYTAVDNDWHEVWFLFQAFISFYPCRAVVLQAANIERTLSRK